MPKKLDNWFSTWNVALVLVRWKEPCVAQFYGKKFVEGIGSFRVISNQCKVRAKPFWSRRKITGLEKNIISYGPYIDWSYWETETRIMIAHLKLEYSLVWIRPKNFLKKPHLCQKRTILRVGWTGLAIETVLIRKSGYWKSHFWVTFTPLSMGHWTILFGSRTYF